MSDLDIFLSLIQVGSYVEDELIIPDEPGLIQLYINLPSQCIGQCAQCELTSAGEEQFMYSNGDFHIVGKSYISNHQPSVH